MNGTSPFIYDMFNIYYFFKSSLVSQNNALLRSVNAITEAFNERPFLPRVILVIIDQDFLQMINQESWGLTRQIEHCTNWYATQLSRAIEARLETLHKKRRGAIAQEETSIIWVEMTERPYIHHKFIMRNRNKFNKSINDMAVRSKNTRVLHLETLKFHHFDTFGQLTYAGLNQYWREVDSKVKSFLMGENELTPQYYIANSSLGVCQPLPFGMRSQPAAVHQDGR